MQALGRTLAVDVCNANGHRSSGKRLEKQWRENDKNNTMDVDGESPRGAQGSADVARLNANPSSADHSLLEGSTDEHLLKRVCGAFSLTPCPFGTQTSPHNTIHQANRACAQPAKDNSSPRDSLPELECPGSHASSNNAGSGP